MDRSEKWPATMEGLPGGDLRFAHQGVVRAVPFVEPPGIPGSTRELRKENEATPLAPGSTRGLGSGDRRRLEELDAWRACFERDRDRILHSTEFRRLAGKTEVELHEQLRCREEELPAARSCIRELMVTRNRSNV